MNGKDASTIIRECLSNRKFEGSTALSTYYWDIINSRKEALSHEKYRLNPGHIMAMEKSAICV